MLLLQFVAHCLHILNRCDLSFTFHVIFSSFFFPVLTQLKAHFIDVRGNHSVEDIDENLIGNIPPATT